jgi:hypothetical protein|tara:strand:- start:2283 stop:2867 length:585 start_codon:yes stop_codon:yes gene_type:complete
MFKYFILFLIFLFSYQKEFPTDWVLKKNKNQIKVYLRNLDYNSQQYCAETIVEADINLVSSHILDFNNSFKWMYKLKSSEILSKESDSLFYVYFIVKMNWPLKNRDLVSDVIVSKTENEIIIELNSVPGHMEINPNFERIKDTKSVWKLEYLTKNKTKVSLQSYAVIEGIPTFISDFFILESPLYSLNNLKDNF